QLLEVGHVAVDQIRGGQTLLLGRQHVFQAVLVGAAEKVHVVAGHGEVPRDGVGLDVLERVPQVRAGIHVRNRGRDKGGWHGSVYRGRTRRRPLNYNDVHKGQFSPLWTLTPRPGPGPGSARRTAQPWPVPRRDTRPGS